MMARPFLSSNAYVEKIVDATAISMVVLYDLTTRRRTVLDNDYHFSAARGAAFANPSLDAGHVFYSAYVELPG